MSILIFILLFGYGVGVVLSLKEDGVDWAWPISYAKHLLAKLKIPSDKQPGSD